MRPEADTDQKAPLRFDAEGLPVFPDWDESPVDVEKATFEAKVAAARQHYNSPAFVEPGETLPVFEKGIAELISDSDAKVAASAKRATRKSNGHPAAPVRKTGKQAEKLLNTVAAAPASVPTPPPAPAEPAPEPEAQEEPAPPAKKRRRRKPVLSPRDRQIEDITDEQLLADAGVTLFYSTTEAAQFFDKTNQWLYWGMGRDAKGGAPVFVMPDGTPIQPERVEGPDSRRRFTLPIIKEILLSSYRRGNIEPEELKKILRRIRINELGGEWREREGWVKIRGKWVHPDQAEKVNGVWVRKKAEKEDSDG